MEPPCLRTERLVIRLARPGEAKLVAAFFRENRAFHAPTEAVHPDSYFTAEFWSSQLERQARSDVQFVHLGLFLFSPDERRIIGHLVLFSIVRSTSQSAYLGYALAEGEQGRGLMHEAASAVIAHAFGPMNLHRLNAGYQRENLRSANVLSRLGFEVEGCAKEYLQLEGRWQDVVLVGLINPDWRETPAEPLEEKPAPAGLFEQVRRWIYRL